jgi:hypothetical protein
MSHTGNSNGSLSGVIPRGLVFEFELSDTYVVCG